MNFHFKRVFKLISDEKIKLLLGLVNWSQRCDRVKRILKEYEKKNIKIKDLQVLWTSDFDFNKRNHHDEWKNNYKWFNISSRGYKFCFLGVKT